MMVRPHTRSAFTLIELLIVIASVAMLVGLLLPAVQQVRQAAGRCQCQNNERQIVLAFQMINDAQGRLPPAVGSFPVTGITVGLGNPPPPLDFGNALYHILPYLEQDTLFKQGRGMAGVNPGSAGDGNTTLGVPSYVGAAWAGFNGVFSTSVNVFQCPSDPGVGNFGQFNDTALAAIAGSTSVDATDAAVYFTSWGTCSYAFNGQVFAPVDKTATDGGPGGYNGDPMVNKAGHEVGPKHKNHGHGHGHHQPVPGSSNLGFGYLISTDNDYGFDGAASFPGSIPDGLSNTVLIAEKYARCNFQGFSGPATDPRNFLQVGGNYWAYDGIDDASDYSPSGYWGFNVVGNGGVGNTGYLPASFGTIPPASTGVATVTTAIAVYPMFAFNLWDGPGTPLFPDNEISIGPQSKPLFQPNPFAGPNSVCDPRLASTPHANMQVGMADGSVRAVTPGISGATWWSAVTPNGGEAPGTDW